MALIGQSATAIIGFVALSPLLWRLSKIFPEVTAISFIPPNVLVNGFMAQAPFHQFKAPYMAYNLFW